MKSVFSWIFRFYRRWISPLFHALSVTLSGNPHSGCKFVPTCSEYSEQAIQKYGFLRGTLKSIYRILRCHPFSKSSGVDPV